MELLLSTQFPVTRSGGAIVIVEIYTDAASQEIEAISVDEAVREFALDEGIDGIYTVADLEAHLERVGGYGSVSVDGVEIMAVRS